MIPLDYRDRIGKSVANRANRLGWLGDFVRAGDQWIHYRTAGSGPAVVLLHGFGVWGYTWRHNFDRLAERHRVYAPDLPGWGLSEKRARGDYSLRAQCAALEAFLNTLGVPTAALVGNSMGGEIAWRFALHRPERVDALVLIASSGYIDTLPDLARRLPRLPGAAWLARLLVGNRRFIARAMREAYYEPDRVVTPEAVEGYVLPLYTPAAMPAFLSTLASVDFGAEAARLPEVSRPTLLLWGENDPWVPLSHGQRMAAEVPGARLVVFPRTGHAPHEERPNEVNRLIEEFLADEIVGPPA